MTLEMFIAQLKGTEGTKDLSPEELKVKAQGMLDEQKKATDALIADAVKASEGKAAGILEDKKKAQEQKAASDEAAATAEAALEEFKKSKMNDKDRAGQDLLDLQKSIKDAQTALVASDAKNKELQTGIDSAARTHKLDEIGSGFTFIEGLPEGAGRKHFIEAAFKDVDLTDAVAVEAQKILFKSTHEGVLVAKAADGTGRKAPLAVSGGTGAGDGNKSERDKEIENMSLKERQKDLNSRR